MKSLIDEMKESVLLTSLNAQSAVIKHILDGYLERSEKIRHSLKNEIGLYFYKKSLGYKFDLIHEKRLMCWKKSNFLLEEANRLFDELRTIKKIKEDIIRKNKKE